jgi:predicted nuclease with TOPRIM domain
VPQTVFSQEEVTIFYYIREKVSYIESLDICTRSNEIEINKLKEKIKELEKANANYKEETEVKTKELVRFREKLDALRNPPSISVEKLGAVPEAAEPEVELIGRED